MDKAQKELLKSYYRQRNIAFKKDDNPKNYEVNKFALSNNLIQLSTYQTIVTLQNKPKLIKYIDDDKLGKIGANEIAFIIYEHPETIKYFKNHLQLLDEYLINQIIVEHPKTLYYFNNIVDNISINIIIKSLIKEPKIIDLFKNRLSEIDIDHIVTIINNKPEFLNHPKYGNFFKKKISEISIGEHIIELLYYQPQLINHEIIGNILKNKINNIEIPDSSIEMILARYPHLKKFF